MCKIYNSVGSLTTIKSHLQKNNINDFNSLNEVLAFQKNYLTLHSEIILEHEHLLEKEKNNLSINISQLDSSIELEKTNIGNKLQEEIGKINRKLINLSTSTPQNFLQRSTDCLKIWFYEKKIQFKEKNIDSRVANSIRKLVKEHTEKNKRFQYIVSNFTDAVHESCLYPLKELERKMLLIDEVKTSILGALGEQKVSKEFQNLSDEYFLINDFSISFLDPVYNRQENDYIKSIQIDHILVSPAGIFLIETKNWSEKSLDNLNLRSPVQQINRTSFALFKILNNENLYLDKHHWGIKKIPLRNLIVFINSKPKEEFQYVKILTLNELLGYVKYFKPIFSNIETQKIAKYLMTIYNIKVI